MKIGDKLIGGDNPCFVVAEIGLNHNGDVDMAKQLIDMAIGAGCDAVKFQKRDPDICVPDEQKGKMRETPWGYITYLDYRWKVEFGTMEYNIIDDYCYNKEILWFASSWDIPSFDFINRFNPPCHKIPSACITDHYLLTYISRNSLVPIILSTGMSTVEEINEALHILNRNDIVILHCNSSYPCKTEELNLNVIKTLKKYGYPIGYSGHETGVFTSVYAVVLGACMVERHITLDRSMWGTDQSSSLERGGLNKLVEEIRTWETAKGDGVKRVYESEMRIREKLRGEIK